MAKCRRIFGIIGMSHVQAILLSWTFAVDDLVAHVLHDITLLSIDGRTWSEHGPRIKNEEIMFLERLRFTAIALGRISYAFLIPKVNNKFLLLGSIMVEVIFLLVGKAIDVTIGFSLFTSLFVVISFIKSAVYPMTLNILSQWSLTTHMTAMYATFEASKFFLASIVLLVAEEFKAAGYNPMNVHVYTTVTVKLVFVAFFMVLGSQEPSSSPFVSPEELADLKKNKPRRVLTHWKNGAPWKGIFTTAILYGCVISEVGFLWSHDLEWMDLLDLMTGYLKTRQIHKLILYYAYIIGCLVNAAIVDLVIRRKGDKYRNNVRKTAATVTAWGGGCSLLLIGYTLNSHVVIMWLTFYHLFKIANFYNGSLFIVYEVSPNYFGLTYALISSVGYLSRVLKPTVEYLLGVNSIVSLLNFYSFLLIFTNLIMLLFGSCRLRDHDSYGTVEWKDESFISFP